MCSCASKNSDRNRHVPQCICQLEFIYMGAHIYVGFCVAYGLLSSCTLLLISYFAKTSKHTIQRVRSPNMEYGVLQVGAPAVDTRRWPAIPVLARVSCCGYPRVHLDPTTFNVFFMSFMKGEQRQGNTQGTKELKLVPVGSQRKSNTGSPTVHTIYVF